MTSMCLGRIVLLVSLFVLEVWGQSDKTQCKSGYGWNRNSLGQDPCTIGSMLDAGCRGILVYAYPPVNGSRYYLLPSGNNPGNLECDCNSVMYNLIMACASCQGGRVGSWPNWANACESPDLAEYPSYIPQGTAVPYWAYFNVTWFANQTYDEATMIRVGRDPEVLPAQTNVTSITSSASSPAITPSPSSAESSTGQPGPTGDLSNNTKGGTNVGAIVGGVIGSVVLLTIFAVVGFFYIRHLRKKKTQQQMRNPVGLGPPREEPPPRMHFYNPSNPSTSSLSPPPSVTYTTPTSSVRGTYAGIPES